MLKGLVASWKRVREGEGDLLEFTAWIFTAGPMGVIFLIFAFYLPIELELPRWSITFFLIPVFGCFFLVFYLFYKALDR